MPNLGFSCPMTIMAKVFGQVAAASTRESFRLLFLEARQFWKRGVRIWRSFLLVLEASRTHSKSPRVRKAAFSSRSFRDFLCIFRQMDEVYFILWR